MSPFLRKCGKSVPSLMFFMGIFMILMPSAANAVTYQIVSTYQHIEGYYEYSSIYYYYPDLNYFSTDSFSASSVTPTSLSDRVDTGYGMSIAMARAFSELTVRADGFAGLTIASGFANYADNAAQIYSGSWSSLSSSEIIFAPNQLSNWQFDISTSASCTISLVDLTTGNTLFNSYGNYEVILSPLNSYKFSMSTTSSGRGFDWGDTYSRGDFSAIASAVPEADSGYLLLISIISVVAMRRYITKARF